MAKGRPKYQIYSEKTGKEIEFLTTEDLIEAIKNDPQLMEKIENNDFKVYDPESDGYKSSELADQFIIKQSIELAEDPLIETETVEQIDDTKVVEPEIVENVEKKDKTEADKAYEQAYPEETLTEEERNNPWQRVELPPKPKPKIVAKNIWGQPLEPTEPSYFEKLLKEYNIKKFNLYLDEIVAAEMEIIAELEPDTNDKLEELEEEIEKLEKEVEAINYEVEEKDDVGESFSNKKLNDLDRKITKLQSNKNRILQDVRERIKQKKKRDIFDIRNKRVKDLIVKMGMAEEFDIDIAESDTEYLEKMEEDLIRQSNELDILIDETTDSKKKKELLKQKASVENELKLLEGKVDPETGKIQMSKGAKEALESHGHINLDGTAAIINAQASLANGGNLNVAAHEFLHKLLLNTLRKNPNIQLAVGKALHKYIMKIDPEGVQNSDFRKRLLMYNTNWDKINKLVDRMNEARKQGNEKLWNKLNEQRIKLESKLAPGQAEEVLTLFSDAIYYNEIKFNETVFTKLGDMFRRIFRFAGVKAKWENPRDVWNWIRDYNNTIETGRGTTALIKEAREGIEIKGELLEDIRIETKIQKGEKPGRRKRKKSVIQQSKSSADTVNDIWQEKGKDGAFDVAEEYRGMANTVYDRYVSQLPRDLQAWIKQQDNFKEDLINGMLFASYGFINKGTSNRSVVGMVQNEFEEARHAYGNLAAYINKFLPLRAVQEFKDNLPQEAKLPEPTDPKPKPKPKTERKKKIALEELGSPKLHNSIRNIVGVSNIELPEQPDYKDVKKLLTSHDGAKLKSKRVPTGELFPVLEKISEDLFGDATIAERLVKEVDFTTKQRTAIQDYIRKKHIELITYVIPKGTSKEGKATGAANTKLGVLYTEGARVKTAAGLKEQQKLHIDPAFLLEQAGMVKGQPTVKTTKVDPFLRSMVIQIGVMSSNQSIRQEKDVLKLTELQVIRLKDGKPSLSFSKPADPKTVDIKPKQNEGDLDAIQKINDLIGSENILDPNNRNHREKMEGFITNVLAEHLPWEFINAATFGVSSRLNSGQFFTADLFATKENAKGKTVVDKTKLIKLGTRKPIQDKVKEIQKGKNNPLKLTQEQIDAVKVAISSKRGYGKGGWYNRYDFTSDVYEDKIQQHNTGVEIILNAFQDIAQIENGKYMPFIAAIFKSQSYSTDHLIRQMAMPKGKENGIGVNNTYSEHPFPSGKMSELMFQAVIRGEVGQLLPFLQEHYYQIGLTKETNMKIDELYKQGFPLEYNDILNEKLKEGYNLPSPIVRYAISGIDLNKITLNNKKSIPAIYDLETKDIEVADEIIKAQNEMIYEVEMGIKTPKEAKNYFEYVSKIPYSKGNNKNKIIDTAVQKARSNYNNPTGMSTFDFDETLIIEGKNFVVATKGKEVIKISSEAWPIEGPTLAKQGYKFDFSDFVNVRGGVDGPLLKKMRNQIDKFGPKNVFVLTARPSEAAGPIHEWLKSKNINIPLGNVTGLGNSTGEAKAMWMLEKFAEGYNDMYFVDDALSNVKAVKNVLDQLDIKSKVVQTKIQNSKKASKALNDILEEATGVESRKRFTDVQAKLKGKKWKFRGLVPPSAQDFKGLLYNMLPKGKKGEEAMEFFEKTLINPFARGVNEINTSRQKAAEDYQALLKAFPDVRKDLKKKLDTFEGFEGNELTVDQAIRVYLWNKAGFDIPGLLKKDIKELVKFIKQDSELQAFADGLSNISKKDKGYGKPSEYWLAENIKSDLLSDGAIGDLRAEYLQEWQNNVDQIFSKQNLNKIEAIYGSKFREALEDSLYAMKTGSNRPVGSNRLSNIYMNWVNNSVGAIMFFNIRSAVLQTISSVNYINWTDNNPLKAGAALANQKQFWKDFVYIFNSDMLKQRRAGNRRGVNESELMNAVIGSDSPVKSALAWLLNKGFLPTQIADSFAIASGGAMFYRNRLNSYLKQGMSQKVAEERAWLDFQEITEVSQQSARPDLISQQQRNPLGRLILAFQNTPMQYGRIMNKAFRDLANRRGDTKTHISKIIYYGGVQAVLFAGLQSAIWASLGEEDEEDLDKKTNRMANTIVDSWLSTFGYGGKAISTVKNTIQEYNKQRAKDLDEDFMTRSDHAYTLLQALSFSPPIGSKVRKIYQSTQTEKFNRDVIAERGFTLDNPLWSAIGNTIEGFTNIPLGRLSNKLSNLDNAMDSRHETWQRVALILGWNKWDLGIKDPDIVALSEDIKEKKKLEKKMDKEKKKIEEKRDKLREEYPDQTDKEIDITIKREEKIKEVFDLKKREQTKIIEDLNLNPKDYPKEQNRVDIIMEHYDKNPEKIDSTLTAIKNYIPSKEEKRSIDLFDLNKKEQLNMLLELGLSSKAIKKLKYEEDRVNKIIQLENKKKSK